MKKITDKEYKDYLEYKDALMKGRIITPNGINLICASFDYNAEKIGKHFLETLNRFKTERR